MDHECVSGQSETVIYNVLYHSHYWSIKSVIDCMSDKICQEYGRIDHD